jgi:16S rRNA (guanine1516-N2)-methyltransferase
MSLSSIPLSVNKQDLLQAQKIAAQWGFSIRSFHEKDMFILEIEKGRLQLRCCNDEKTGPVYVDFIDGAMMFRRRFARGQEAIAKAVGLKKGFRPIVLDATAGLGRDSFVLASLGCQVYMLERSPVIAALLDDGLKRAKQDPIIGSWVSERMSLVCADSQQELSALSFQPDVVYLDPMFPHRQKSALVKKEMRVLQFLLGEGTDADGLLALAMGVARKRVVVKRPAYAGHLADKLPDAVIKTPRNRFDIYLI